MSVPPRDRAAVWWRLAPLLLLVLLVVLWFVLRPGDGKAPAESGPTTGESEAGEHAEPGPLSPTPAERRWIETTGSPPTWPADLDSPGDCREALAALHSLCARLDRMPDVAELDLPAGTFALLIEVSAALEASPPVAENELRDVLDTRQNVAHVFRTLGERRTLWLLSIATAHPEFAEPMAMAIYRWLRAAGTCEGAGPRPMGLERQREYAAFLLNTVGGQAYLRRRAPENEALASFYALLIAERAVREGADLFGVRLVPEIDRCTRLIENRPSLVFRDRYLETLQRIRPR